MDVSISDRIRGFVALAAGTALLGGVLSCVTTAGESFCAIAIRSQRRRVIRRGHVKCPSNPMLMRFGAPRVLRETKAEVLVLTMMLLTTDRHDCPPPPSPPP